MACSKAYQRGAAPYFCGDDRWPPLVSPSVKEACKLDADVIANVPKWPKSCRGRKQVRNDGSSYNPAANDVQVSTQTWSTDSSPDNSRHIRAIGALRSGEQQEGRESSLELGHEQSQLGCHRWRHLAEQSGEAIKQNGECFEAPSEHLQVQFLYDAWKRLSQPKGHLSEQEEDLPAKHREELSQQNDELSRRNEDLSKQNELLQKKHELSYSSSDMHLIEEWVVDRVCQAEAQQRAAEKLGDRMMVENEVLEDQKQMLEERTRMLEEHIELAFKGEAHFLTKPRHWAVAHANFYNDFYREPTFETYAERVYDQSKLQAISRLLGHSSCNRGFDCIAFHQRVQIVRVMQVHNSAQWSRYMDCKRHMTNDHRRFSLTPGTIEPPLPPASRQFYLDYGSDFDIDASVNEALLFHGTSWDIATKDIATRGFDFRLSKFGYYGSGVYFASNGCKSHQYAKAQGHTRTVIISRVALGDMCWANRVHRELKRPPRTSTPSGHRRCFDSVVARPGPMPGHVHGVQAHQEFVIFDNCQAYPEFIVEYTV